MVGSVMRSVTAPIPTYRRIIRSLNIYSFTARLGKRLC